MTGTMPIGVFARATRLSVRVLRNYDRLGLLVRRWSTRTPATAGTPSTSFRVPA